MAEMVAYETDTSDMLIPHAMFRSVLTEAPGLILRTAGDDRDRCAAVGSYLDNVLRFLDAHHGGEDALVWPVLQQRCPLDASLIARMETQHATIHHLRERIDPLLSRWTATTDPAAGAALAEAIETLRAELEVHFGEEETGILPLASRSMSPEEWGALPGHAMAHFTGDKIWLILGLVLEQMTDERRAMTLQLLPQPAAQMWTTTGNAAFDEFIARVRG